MTSCAGVTTNLQYACEKKKFLGHVAIKVLAVTATVHLHAFTELLQQVENIYRTMELLKVMVLVGAFVHVSMALSIQGEQNEQCRVK